MSLSHESAEPKMQPYFHNEMKERLHNPLEVPDALNPELLEKDNVWCPEYGRYDQGITYQRLEEIRKYLQKTGVWNQETEKDFISSVRFVDTVFEEYQNPETFVHKRSFAFVVPNRMERGREEYSAEVTTKLPIMKHFGSYTRQLVFTDIPPFVLDRYGDGASERNGYMVYAPVMTDMMKDHSRPREKFQEIMDHTIEFADNNLGVDTVGLGAILPKLTNYGESVKKKYPELTVTTGHAATVWLIGETLKRAIDEGYVKEPEKTGIVGAGAIGRSTMHYLIEGLGYKPEDIYITDDLFNKSRKVANEIQNVNVANSNAELMDNADVIISAVTRPIDLEDTHSNGDIEGKLIIDDSQPGSFDKEQVSSRNGILAWVIGKDNSPDRILTGGDFDYAGLGPAEFDQVWGCQAEALIAYLSPELALHGREVELTDVVNIGKKMRELGISAAPLQSHGQEYRKQ